MERVGQKTLWRHNILQAYKVQKVFEVEKRVDLHLIAVYYNRGERQKGTHQRTSLSTAAFTVKPNPVFKKVQTFVWHQNAACYRILNAPTAKFTRAHRMWTFNLLNQTDFLVHTLYGHNNSPKRELTPLNISIQEMWSCRSALFLAWESCSFMNSSIHWRV